MTWTQLIAPAGGRRYLGGNFAGVFSWAGARGVCAFEGVLTRIDRAAGVTERVAVPDTVCAVAVSVTGRYAFSDGAAVELDGGVRAAFAGASSLAFGAGGDLWAVNNRQVARIDGRTGAVRWAVDACGSRLAVDGDTAVLASWGSVTVVRGDGALETRASTARGEVSALTARGGSAYVMAQEGTRRELSRWDLATLAETVFEPPAGVPVREMAATRDGVLAWRDAPLGLREFDTRDGSTRPLAFPSGPTVGLSTDDDRSWVAVQEWESAVVRVERETGRELDRERPAPATLWALSVAPDGRVATGHDGEWRVTGPDGALLHRAACDAQVSDVAFSVDGARLAVLRTGDAMALDLVETHEYTVIATHPVSAGKVLFLPDGARLALVDDVTITLCDAASLGVECVLQHTKKDDSLRGVVYAERRFATHDGAGRVVLFDDPGACAVTKKPAKHKPALVAATTAACASTAGASNRMIGAVFPRDGGAVVFDGNLPGLVTLDLATKKASSKTKGPRGFFCLDAPVYAREEPAGCSLWRLGDAAPFATWGQLPTMAACSRDGRVVVVALHGGVYLTRR